MKNTKINFKETNTSPNPSKGGESPISFGEGLEVRLNLMKITVLKILLLGGFSSFAQGFQPFVGSGGTGDSLNPYLISTPADLVELSNYVNSDSNCNMMSNPLTSCYYDWAITRNTYGKYFKMTNDIDMANINFIPIGIGECNGDGIHYDSIHNTYYVIMYSFAFSGNFDGGGFSIKNLTPVGINDPIHYPGQYMALFGKVVLATISNLTLDSAFITNIFDNNIAYATFVGIATSSNFDNCVVKNCIIAVSPSYLPSLNGFAYGVGGGTINNCHVINTEILGIGNSLSTGFCRTINEAQVTNSSVSNSIISGLFSCGFAMDIQKSSVSSCCVSNCVFPNSSVVGFVETTQCSQISNCYTQIPLLNITYNCHGFLYYDETCTVFDGEQVFYIHSTTMSNCYAAYIFTDNYSFCVGRDCFDLPPPATAITYNNCYYLLQPPLAPFWDGRYSSGMVGKNQTDLQSPNMVSYPGTATNSLNLYQPSKPWKSDCRYKPINQGYPILSWQYLPSAVVSLAATDTTLTSVTLHGVVVNNDDTLVEKGFQWRAVGDSVWITIIVSDTITTDSISAQVFGLTSGTAYEFKTYAIVYNIGVYYTTHAVTKYGDTLTFFTLEPSIVITLEADDITQTSATLYGIIIEKDEPVLERGFEWRQTGDSIWITITVSDITDTIFAPLTELTSNTLYEFKAYLTTTDTTKYGDTLTFSTLEIPSTVTTLESANITQNSAILNGEVIENDEVVVERGFEWRQVGAENWTTVLAAGTENILYSLTELTPKTHYEFAAYIRTSILKYGEILSFTTLEETTPDNVTNYVSASSIRIFPNPTNGQLTINNEQLTISTIEIYDVVGQLLYQINKSTNNQINNEISIDVSHLENGIYFVKISTEDGSQSVKKVVKQ